MAEAPAKTQGIEEVKWVPRIYVDLTKSDIDELKGVKVGQKVRLVIIGKVVEVSQRQDDRGKTGAIGVENYTVAAKPVPLNPIEQLVEDE